MRKSIAVLIVSAVVLLLAVSCSSSSFKQDGITTNLAIREYQELGDFTYSSSRVGYSDILAKARILYPDCDDVIDIYTETVDSTILFIFHTRTINVYATAIKWLDVPENGLYKHTLD